MQHIYIDTVYTSEPPRTHMHHQWYCLHLNWCWGAQPSISEVLEDAGIEMIFRLQLIKCTHRVWNVRAVYIYTVLRTNSVNLKIKLVLLRIVTEDVFMNKALNCVSEDLFLMKMFQSLQ